MVEAELEKVKDELVVKTRLATIGQVAASIAHDLRNPLSVLRNAEYYLRRHLPCIGEQPIVEILSRAGVPRAALRQQLELSDRLTGRGVADQRVHRRGGSRKLGRHV